MGLLVGNEITILYNAFDSVHSVNISIVDSFAFHTALQGAHRIQDRHAKRRMTSR
jgi:hypothetical protein